MLVPRRRLRSLALLALSALLLGACPDGGPAEADEIDETDAAPGPHDAGDAGAGDPDGALDVSSADSSPPDGAMDGAAVETLADVPDAGDVEEAGPACTPPPELMPDPLDASQTRFALSLYHFNVEYVIGGLEVTDEDGVEQTVADWPEAAGWDNDRVEDWIIVETLAPILALYEAHPGWRVDIEMQAYMVEVMAARHPALLEQLRRLAQSGQVELISFHYADQLFLAYPREDLARSIVRTREVFAEHCLPLSGVVFNQEGQAGEGRQEMLVASGYEIGVFPKNLFRYVHGEAPRWPVYESRGGYLIVGPGGVDPASGVEVAWDFFDDGELRAVPEGINPYMAFLAGADPDRVADLEAELTAREAAGYKLTTISDYVRQIVAQGIEVKPAPPLLDGTWQPPSTESIHRWLGGRSQAFPEAEEDNHVRTGNARARVQVAAAQVLVDHARDQGLDVTVEDVAMRELWQSLWHAQVSDCSGVNPWRGEVLYGLRMNAWLLDATAELRAGLFGRLGYDGRVAVSLEHRTVTPLPDDLSWPEPQPPSLAPPFDVASPVVRADGRAVSLSWTGSGPEWILTVDVGAADATLPCDGCDLRLVSVAFPIAQEVIEYSPGLIEDEVVAHPFDAFDFLQGEAYLPLANGLIGLGGGRYVIKDTRTCHIAARVAPGSPTIDFIDASIPADQAASWRFHVLDATQADALAAANRLNTHPDVVYSPDGTSVVTPESLP